VALVDVVVVSYNSRRKLRRCVDPLLEAGDIRVIVADNASADGSLEAVAGLPVTALALPANGGFAHGCNAGIAAGDAPYVLLLNPDAEIQPDAVRRLAEVLGADERLGAAAPRIEAEDGSLEFSQRRFPRLRSTYAQALFLHRVFPRARWVDELERDLAAYDLPGSPEWVSGACVLLRRTALEAIGGLDDGFFMYCEDIDLCRRLRDAGYELRFVPDAVVTHEGGASAPRASLLPVLAASRVRYARKHRGRVGALLERGGVALGALTHALVSRGGRAARAGHLRAFRRALADGLAPH
jgi:N-acetylglucosaminyl-diphospho-decaprenol L-rhamnosyltransferase